MLRRLSVAEGAAIASAAALTPGLDGNFYHITGTVGMTSIASIDGAGPLWTIYDDAVLLTHNATSLILLGGANYTTVAGDVICWMHEGAGSYRELFRSMTGSDPVGTAKTQTLTNKTLTAPTLSGTVAGTYTLGGIPTLPAISSTNYLATTSAQLAGVISDETGSGLLVFGTSPTIVTPTLSGTVAGTYTLGGIPTLPAISSTNYSATTSAQLAGVISDETGSGLLVFGTSPTIVTPTLSGTVVGTYTIGGTPTLPAISSTNYLATTSAQLAGVISDETGSGLLVFGTSPTIVTPTIAATGWTNATHAHTAASSGGQVSAADLSGATLASGVTASSLTSFGALSTLTLSTSLTSPLLVGGTGVGSTLALRSTSGIGSSDAVIFQVGNNGATEAGRILTGGRWNINSGSSLRTGLTTEIRLDLATSVAKDGADAQAFTAFFGSSDSVNPMGVYFGFRSNPTGTSRYGTLDAGEIGIAARALVLQLETGHNVKIGGSALRSTTEGKHHLDIFNGVLPAGTLANGETLYSSAGELNVLDSAGNNTLLSPHSAEVLDAYTDLTDVLPWVHRHKNAFVGKESWVVMSAVIREVEKLSGKKFIQVQDLAPSERLDWDDDQSRAAVLEPAHVKVRPPKWMADRGVKTQIV